ncbi:MAG: hypothetical protein WCH85_11830 [Methanomicrobiales archaeon]
MSPDGENVHPVLGRGFSVIREIYFIREPQNPAGIGYPGLYEVQDGVAHFLFQAKSHDDIVLPEVQQGDIIAIPPGLWTRPRWNRPSRWQILSQRHLPASMLGMTRCMGLAYYELVGGVVQKDPAYPEVPPVRKVRDVRSIISSLGPGNSLYDFVRNDRIARVLNNPEDYFDFLSGQLRES